MYLRRVLFPIWVVGLVLSLTPILEAQLNRGEIEGIVTDPQGAVVPEVSLTITNVDTNVSVPTKTNSAGYYRVVDLVPGKYRARFEHSGFSPLDITDIEVPAGKVTRVDTQLKLGQALQTVEVRAEVPLLETAASNFSTTLETRTIEEVPLAGRDLMQLVFLVPGINSVAGPPGSNFGFSSEFGTFPDPTYVLGSQLSVNGGQAGANAWYLDGNLNLSSYAENIAVNPTPDAVSEFQVISNAFAAEYSRTGGAVFNVVLKSGTNKLHGNIYEFHRQSATNARNPFTSVGIDPFTGKSGLIKDRQLHYNNFGGTLGGPVILPKLYNGKDKTFFFFSWDVRILHLAGREKFSVPTARERQGDFSEDVNAAQYGIWDPLTGLGPDVNGFFARSAFGTPITPNGCTGFIDSTTGLAVNPTPDTCAFSTQIPPDRFDPTAMFFINSFPSPNHIDTLGGCPLAAGGAYSLCNNFLGTVATSQVPHNVSIKIDHQWSQRSKYFFEWLFNPGKYRNYRVPWTGPTYPASRVGYGTKVPLDFKNQIFGLGNTYTFGPTFFNEFHYNFSRQLLNAKSGAISAFNKVAALQEVEKVTTPLRLPSSQFYPAPDFDMSTPGGGSIHFGIPAWSSSNVMSEAHTFLDNVTKIIGRHTLKTGFVYRLEHAAWDSSNPTQLEFYGGLTTNPITYAGGGSGLAQFMLGAPEQYSEAGLWNGSYERWRYWGAYVQDDFRITPRFSLNLGLRWDLYGWLKSRWKPDAKFCLSCVNPLTDLPGKVIYAGDPELPIGHDLNPANKKNFGPRINFSWSPFADRKTVIRGGYNLFTSNAANANNFTGEFSEPGWQVFANWPRSFYPDKCASFSYQCLPFPLSDTTIDKAPLAFPSITEGYPAQKRDPLFGQEFFDNDKPTREPMVQMWGLEVERELPGNMVLSLGYAGSHGTHLFGAYRYFWYQGITQNWLKYRYAMDAVIPITDVFSDPKTVAQLEKLYGSSGVQRSRLLNPYPFFYPLQSATYDGTNVYHGLNVRLQKKYSHGFNFIAAYTYSKNMTNGLTANLTSELVDAVHGSQPGGRASAVENYYGQYQDPDNEVEHVIAIDDVPHMLNVAAAYEFPFGSGKAFLNRKGIVNGVFGGWKLAANFNAQSGIPLRVRGPCSGLQASVWGDCRPNLIGNPKFPGGRSKEQRIAQWMNPAAFEPPFGTDPATIQAISTGYYPDGTPFDYNSDIYWTFGNMGPQLAGLRSPGFWNVDSSLTKRFPISESKYFEFRWEMFNALNHQNLALPNTGWCLPPKPDGSTDVIHQVGCTFGRITNIATDARSMEFGLKFFW